jgi:hypothetical protein
MAKAPWSEANDFDSKFQETPVLLELKEVAEQMVSAKVGQWREKVRK